MCYSVAYIERRAEELANRYKDVLLPDLNKQKIQLELPFFYFVSGFSHPHLPIIIQEGIFLFEWGLIPSWTKDSKSASEIQTKTLNAVGETVFDKPTFRKSIASRRCLLGVNGFYEWRDVNKVKYPYFIHMKSNPIFSLGCIYETWIDKSTGEERNTFSILTTPANHLMEKIHNLKKRMPLILSKQNEKKWIDPNLTTEQIRELIKPYNESDMNAYPVSNLANNVRNNRNVPEIMEEIRSLFFF